jgi:hypothetical protein
MGAIAHLSLPPGSDVGTIDPWYCVTIGHVTGTGDLARLGSGRSFAALWESSFTRLRTGSPPLQRVSLSLSMGPASGLFLGSNPEASGGRSLFSSTRLTGCTRKVYSSVGHSPDLVSVGSREVDAFGAVRSQPRYIALEKWI